MASQPKDRAEDVRRLKVVVRGAVQGVGFRPFVFRLAEELQLKGWVNNSTQGVFLEVEGPKSSLEGFLLRLEAEKPPRSSIQSLEASWLDAVGYTEFTIRKSESGGTKTALVLPDIATCPDCLREILEPGNRRYFYPFTNCTNCGPRFSIIEALPYDRANTSMRQFTMCPACQAEYENPRDRRFHAQPNACPVCGPHLELWDAMGKVLVGTGAAGQTEAAEVGSSVPERRRAGGGRPDMDAAGKRGALGERALPGEASGQRNRSRAVLEAAAEAIRAGRIVAVKGLGGFHLLVAAHDDAAVRRLRERKHREEKPFAVMFPSLASVRCVCDVSALEERLLRAPEAPIVLLRRRQGDERPVTEGGETLSPEIAPHNPNLGALLPYTPLHHLLLSLVEFPVVATSGNLSDEPICIEEQEAVSRLAGIADLFLVHNRPIVRHVDDSVVRVMAGRELVLRRARGYAPLPVDLGRMGAAALAAGARRESAEGRARWPQRAGSGQSGLDAAHTPAGPRRAEASAPYPAASTAGAGPEELPSVLGVGAHLKNTVALSVGPQVFISQHIGDLETDQAFEAFRRVIGDLKRLYACAPSVIAADAHPDYLSTKYAQEYTSRAGVGTSRPQMLLASESGDEPSPPLCVSVQHHVAHVLSCMAENELSPPVLGVSWDGTGYGLDGTIWGGEFFLITETGWERVAHLRPFRLPGGDKAVKEPRRTALGLLFELFGEAAFARQELAPVQAFSAAELSGIKTMLARGLNSPLTSSAGRLFDAVAALAGLRQQVRFEGQAAMELEFALEGMQTDEAYAFALETTSNPAASQASRSAHSAFSLQPSALLLNWAPVIESLLSDLQRGLSVGQISARFHNGLVEAILEVAERVAAMRVVLSGGCFQNRYLTERAVQRLGSEGFRPYWHQRVPPNDGGIALGQVVEALRQRRRQSLKLQTPGKTQNGLRSSGRIT